MLALTLVAALGCREDAESPTDPEPGPALVATSIQALPFRQVSAGGSHLSSHTCGLTTDNRAYCWGNNLGGQLGDGTTTRRLTPVAVAGGLRFLEVRAGGDGGLNGHTCGVTTNERVYCWGSNDFSQLGDGTTTRRLTPVAVAGGRRFRQVSAGSLHTCAVTPFDVAFCWGSSEFGRLGTGGGDAATPVRVAGGLRFRRVIAAYSHTCGTTTDSRAYCWGDNQLGQLGDGTRIRRPKPVAVAGGHRFRQVLPSSGWISSAGAATPDAAHTCGVTTSDRAYCWGHNRDGQLGDGTNTHRSTPVAVAGGRRFSFVNPGEAHTCGVTPFDVAFCWGSNSDGQLGTGGSGTSTPARVAGGLRFRGLGVSAIGRHACGVTTDNRAYCWGVNFSGQLGDGTTTGRSIPVAVAGAM